VSKTELRLTGMGGQGIVLSGYLVGRACAIHSGMHATMTQSFGPEARGSACSTQLVISKDEVLYPYIRGIDILVAFSGDGYIKYKDGLKSDGILIHEKDLVEPSPGKDQKVFACPSTRIAESLGRVVVQNIVMMGFFAAATGLTSKEAMRQAVEETVPAGTEELNLKAFDAGWDYFQETYGGWDKAGKKRKVTVTGKKR
jgi:2-oxoglutarate ferredoxin oxidoreductase subunit gamma